MTMETNKRYDEALARARNFYEFCKKSGIKNTAEIILNIFPELRERDDERIRKTLIEFFSKGAENNSLTNGISDKDILAWLEKQGEQKPADKIEQEYNCTGVREPKEATGVLKQLLNKENYAWSDEDEAYRVDILVKLEPHITDDNFTDVQNWFKSIKDRVQPQPKQEWSEEDKVKINRIVAVLEHLKIANDSHLFKKDIDWLKSLKFKCNIVKGISKYKLLKKIQELEDKNNCGTSDFIESKRIAFEHVKEVIEKL